MRLNLMDEMRDLHCPVDVEPSGTLCSECSFQLPNGRYFGKLVKYPRPTMELLERYGERRARSTTKPWAEVPRLGSGLLA